jgi:hypothetical protein
MANEHDQTTRRIRIGRIRVAGLLELGADDYLTKPVLEFGRPALDPGK